MVCRRKKTNDTTCRSIAWPCSRCVWLCPAATDDPDLRKCHTYSFSHSFDIETPHAPCLSVFLPGMTYDPTVMPVPASGGTQPPGRRRSPLKPSQSLCKSDLLKNVSIVLFLNKCDELEQKLALGLRVEDFVTLSTKREAGSDVESVKNCECIHIFTTLRPAILLVWLLPSQSANDAACQRTRFDQPRNGKRSQCECLTDRPERDRSCVLICGAPDIRRLSP